MWSYLASCSFRCWENQSRGSESNSRSSTGRAVLRLVESRGCTRSARTQMELRSGEWHSRTHSLLPGIITIDIKLLMQIDNENEKRPLPAVCERRRSGKQAHEAKSGCILRL